MEYKLLKMFKNELYAEAKKLVNSCYDENDLINCSYDALKENVDNKYKSFIVDLHMMTVSLCIMKNEGKKYEDEQINYKELIDHHLKVIDGKKEIYNQDLREIANKVANDIIINSNIYNAESLYSLIPKLTKKYAKFHNESVDWECIVMLLEEELAKKNLMLTSSDIKDLCIVI